MLDWEAKGGLGIALWWLNEVVKSINNGEASDFLLWAHVAFPALVPRGLVGFGYKVVSVKARIGDERNLLGLEADRLEHLDKFSLDFFKAFLGPVAGIHLVDTHNDLFHPQEVKKAGVLSRLTLFDAHLRVGLCDG